MIRRPRRLRVTKQIRDLVHETSIDKTDLIYPMFIIDGETEDIPSMPNIKRYSLTDLPSALDEVVLFSLPVSAARAVVHGSRHKSASSRHITIFFTVRSSFYLLDQPP